MHDLQQLRNTNFWNLGKTLKHVSPNPEHLNLRPCNFNLNSLTRFLAQPSSPFGALGSSWKKFEGS